MNRNRPKNNVLVKKRHREGFETGSNDGRRGGWRDAAIVPSGFRPFSDWDCVGASPELLPPLKSLLTLTVQTWLGCVSLQVQLVPQNFSERSGDWRLQTALMLWFWIVKVNPDGSGRTSWFLPGPGSAALGEWIQLISGMFVLLKESCDLQVIGAAPLRPSGMQLLPGVFLLALRSSSPPISSLFTPPHEDGPCPL